MKNATLLKFISIFVGFVFLKLFVSRTVVENYLDNKDCKNGVTHRLWNESYMNSPIETKPLTFNLSNQNEMIIFIVLHYTAETSANETVKTFNDSGASAHYIIDNDGTIIHTVNEERYTAYHAGNSYFAGKISLNNCSIGIEISNPGFTEDGKKFSSFSDPIQLPGDSRWWYPFSKEQFQSCCKLVRTLQEKYKIPGWYVVTHADIAPSRKSDIGPMWDYKKAFDDFGVGYFPSKRSQVDLSDFSQLSEADYIKLIGCLGYDLNDKNVIQSYQLHFSTSNISGDLCESTKKNLLEHVIAVYDYIDPITGKKFDFFRNEFKKWMNANPEKASAFSKYLHL